MFTCGGCLRGYDISFEHLIVNKSTGEEIIACVACFEGENLKKHFWKEIKNNVKYKEGYKELKEQNEAHKEQLEMTHFFNQNLGKELAERDKCMERLEEYINLDGQFTTKDFLKLEKQQLF